MGFGGIAFEYIGITVHYLFYELLVRKALLNKKPRTWKQVRDGDDDYGPPDVASQGLMNRIIGFLTLGLILWLLVDVFKI